MREVKQVVRKDGEC